MCNNMKNAVLIALVPIILVPLITPASAHITASVQLTPSILLPGDTTNGTLTITNKGTTSIRVTGVTFFSDLSIKPKSISQIGYIPPAGTYELPFRVKTEKAGLYTVEAYIYTTNGTLKQVILVDVRDLIPEIVLTSAITLNEVNTVSFKISDPLGVSDLKIEPLFNAEPRIIYPAGSEGTFIYYASEKKELKFRISFYNGENYHEVTQTIMPEYRVSKGVLMNVSLPYDVVCLKDVVPVRIELTNLRGDEVYSLCVKVSSGSFTKATKIASLSSMESKSVEIICPTQSPGEQNVSVTLSFKDSMSNPYTSKEYVKFRVLREKAVSVSNIDVKWNEGMSISGDVSNNGKSTVYNVMVALQSGETVKMYYLGTINPSDFDSFEFSALGFGSSTTSKLNESITPKLVISWNNELGEKVNEVVSIPLPQKPEFKTESNPTIVVISAVVFVAVVAIVALAWMRKK